VQHANKVHKLRTSYRIYLTEHYTFCGTRTLAYTIYPLYVCQIGCVCTTTYAVTYMAVHTRLFPSFLPLQFGAAFSSLAFSVAPSWLPMHRSATDTQICVVSSEDEIEEEVLAILMHLPAISRRRRFVFWLSVSACVRDDAREHGIFKPACGNSPNVLQCSWGQS